MRLGSSLLNDSLLIGVGNDYADLCDLNSPSTSSFSFSTNPFTNASSWDWRRDVNSGHHMSSPLSSCSMNNYLRNCFEAEDVPDVPYYDRTRLIGASTGSLCALNGLNSLPSNAHHYYSLENSSYSAFDRPKSPRCYYTNGFTSSSLRERDSFGAPSRSKRFYYNDPLTYRSYSGQRRITRSTPDHMHSSPFLSTSQGNNYQQPHLLYSDSNDQSSPTYSCSPSNSYLHGSRNGRERGDRAMITKTVTMMRDLQPDGSHGFGICVKGGRETGVGVYISRVEESSIAERVGLCPGLTIVEVNGSSFSGMTHDQALAILKSSRQITMTVRGPTSLHGFGPPSGCDVFNKSSPITGALLSPPSRQTCSWMDPSGRPASPPHYSIDGRRSDRRDRIRQVELIIEPGQSLGLMIRGGIEYGLGIYVTGVDKDSVADRAGLMVGDQIIEVNSQSFLNVTHDEAVNQFKFHKRMTLLVRDIGKVPHSFTIEPDSWDDNGRKKCPVSAMVEEKARSLLPRHQFSNLSFYIKEYGARGITIDAFVSILLEMLDTAEKHTLVTEIRELIYPEDRPRFDEIVYRRYTTGNKTTSTTAVPTTSTSSRIEHYDPRHINYLKAIGNQIGGFTRKVKSWYLGRPLEFIVKQSKSFDLSDADEFYRQRNYGNNIILSRYQSLQRLPTEDNDAPIGDYRNDENLSHIVPDENGNLFITVKKTKPILGIAIEGGANTKHPLPRIINIHEHGAAYEAGGLEVGQLILKVDETKVEGMQHQDVAHLIAECYANREKDEITFLVVEAKKSNLEPKPTALVFLEQ